MSSTATLASPLPLSAVTARTLSTVLSPLADSSTSLPPVLTNLSDGTDCTTLQPYVQCALQPDGNVTVHTINMDGLHLGGRLPSDLYTLPHLTRLSLSHLHLRGPIPPSFFSSNSLQRINISHNNLSGSLPVSVAYTSRLTSLDLSNNPDLGGVLPLASIASHGMLLNTLHVHGCSFRANLSTTLNTSLYNLTSCTLVSSTDPHNCFPCLGAVVPPACNATDNFAFSTGCAPTFRACGLQPATTTGTPPAPSLSYLPEVVLVFVALVILAILQALACAAIIRIQRRMDGPAGHPLLSSAPVPVAPATADTSAEPPRTPGRTLRSRSTKPSRSSSTSSLAVNGVDQSSRTRSKSRSTPGNRATFEVPQTINPAAATAPFPPHDEPHRHPLDGHSLPPPGYGFA